VQERVLGGEELADHVRLDLARMRMGLRGIANPIGLRCVSPPSALTWWQDPTPNTCGNSQ
jgi:hypothetical protein